MEPLEAARIAHDDGMRVVVVKVTGVEGEAPSRVGLTLTVTEDNTTYGSLGCDGFDRAAAEDAESVLDGRRVVSSYYPWEDGAGIAVEVRLIEPMDGFVFERTEISELLVVGTGPVARSLVAIAETMGFHVRVAAGPRSPSVGEFEGADEVIVTPEAKDVEALRPGSGTYVVICGHDTEFSQPVLRALISTEAPYLGMMGSRRHTAHIYEELRGLGVSEQRISVVHTPVGIDIGAEAPEEIALSVLAQIVAIRRGSQALGHLSGPFSQRN